MSYIGDWKEWEDNARAAREANPLCDQSASCPAPDDGHLVGCRRNRIRLGMTSEPVIAPGGYHTKVDLETGEVTREPLRDPQINYSYRPWPSVRENIEGTIRWAMDYLARKR